MLAAPCRPTRGLFTFIQLSFCSVSERLRCPFTTRRFFVFGAPFRMPSDRHMVVILLHMLRESSCCLNRGLRGFS